MAFDILSSKFIKYKVNTVISIHKLHNWATLTVIIFLLFIMITYLFLIISHVHGLYTSIVDVQNK